MADGPPDVHRSASVHRCPTARPSARPGTPAPRSPWSVRSRVGPGRRSHDHDRHTTRATRRSRRDERGITTAEYAVGTAAGAGLAGLLYKLLTGGFGDQLLQRRCSTTCWACWASGDARPGGRASAGAVTAELALGMPLLVALTAGLVWLLAVGAAQVRTVDAARETARALARGDDSSARPWPWGRGSRPRAPRCSVAVEGEQVRCPPCTATWPGRRCSGGAARRRGQRRGGRRWGAVVRSGRPGDERPVRRAVDGPGRLRRAAVVVAAASAVVTAVVVHHRARAQSAADLAALAGAAALVRGEAPAHGRRRVAAANAALVGCRADGRGRSSGARCRSPGRAGSARGSTRTAEARAGPA